MESLYILGNIVTLLNQKVLLLHVLNPAVLPIGFVIAIMTKLKLPRQAIIVLLINITVE